MSRRGWWAVLVAGVSALLVAAVSLGTTGSTAEDFSDAAVTLSPVQQSAGSATDPARTPDGPRAGRDPATVRPRVEVAAPRAAPGAPAVARRSASLEAVVPPVREAAEPVRVLLPELGIDAPVSPTGVREDGQMDVPDSGSEVGWYRYGPAPGEGRGSAVLASHVTTRDGDGIFAALAEVAPGTEVEVELADGSTVRYAVRSRTTLPKAELPLEAVFSRSGPEQLTLITCGGPWIASQDSYRDNVVVVAEPVGS